MLTEAQLEAMKMKLDLLQSGQKLVTPDQRDKTHRRYAAAHVRAAHRPTGCRVNGDRSIIVSLR